MSAASEAAPEGSSTSFMRSNAVFIALRTEASVTVRPLTPASRTAANGATPGRRAISPSQIELGAERHGLDRAMRQRVAHAVEAGWLDADDLGRRRQIVEGERHAADQPAAADRAEQQVGLGALGRQLVERLETGAGLAGDDLGIVERVQQRKAFLLGDLARPFGRHFLARPRAVVGDDDARAVAGSGVALGGRRVDRHDDGDRNAERLAGGGQALREIAGGVGDDAALAPRPAVNCFSRQ